MQGVFKAFRDIATTQGQGSQTRKQGAIAKLLSASQASTASEERVRSCMADWTCDANAAVYPPSSMQGNEAGYIMRSLQGKLRIGLADQTLLAALAHAALLHHMEKRGEALRGEQLAEVGSVAGVRAQTCDGVAVDALLAFSTQRMVRAEGIVKKAYSDLPSFDLVVPPLAEYGPDALPEHCTFRPGLPGERGGRASLGMLTAG